MPRIPSRPLRAVHCLMAIVGGLFLPACASSASTARETPKPSPTPLEILECNDTAGKVAAVYASTDFNDASLPYPVPDMITPLSPDTLPLLPVSVTARLHDSSQAAPEYFHTLRFIAFNLTNGQIVYDATISYNANGTVIETPPGPGGPANTPQIIFGDPGEPYFEIQWVPAEPGNYILIVMDRYVHADKIGPYAETHACITIRDSLSPSTDTPTHNFFGEEGVPTEQYGIVWNVCHQIAADMGLFSYGKSPTLPFVDDPLILNPADESVLPMGPVALTYQLPAASDPAYLIRTGYRIFDLQQMALVEERQPAVMTSTPESIVSEEWTPQHPGYYLWILNAQNFLPGFRNSHYLLSHILVVDESGPFSQNQACFIVGNLPTITPTASPTTVSNPPTDTPTATTTETPIPTATQKPRPLPTETPGPQPTECSPVAPCP